MSKRLLKNGKAYKWIEYNGLKEAKTKKPPGVDAGIRFGYIGRHEEDVVRNDDANGFGFPMKLITKAEAYMERLLIRLSAVMVCIIVCFAFLAEAFANAPDLGAIVQVYPAPNEERITDAYRVTVDGKPVDVYSAQTEGFEGDYYFAYFDFSGKVKIEIQAPFSVDKARLLPERFGFAMKTTGQSAAFEADKPFRVSFEPNGRIKPLLVFGNALESDVPAANAPNVVYFGPGVHRVGKIELTSNQTLYVAGGAVVKGCVQASGNNITIRGRGIIAGEEYPRFQGPGRYPLDCQNCSDLVVRDIILRNPWSWTAVTWNCDRVLIDGLKICGSRMINDDALDLVNTQNATIRNCFFRTQDDCIAIKGIDNSRRPCENILIEDCVFWTDVANVYRIGYECDAEWMRNIVSRRIDALHFSRNYRQPHEYWSNAVIWLQPNLEMVMEDCRFEDFVVYSDGSNILMLMAKPMRCFYGPHREKINPGILKNCSFKDLRVVGEKGAFKGLICILGDSPQWNVDGLTFENVRYFGELITEKSTCVQIGPHASNVRFQ